VTSDNLSAATLGSVSVLDVRHALAGQGIWLDVGLATVRVRSSIPHAASEIQSIYRNFPWRTGPDWADIHAELRMERPWRSAWTARSRFWCDGQPPYEAFPLAHAVPLMEWGINYQIARRMNDHVLLHAGVVEKDGLALVLPALPGSGKSTLTAALSVRGWRLFSDEFGAYDLEKRHFRPVLKPVGLKNKSIDVIRQFDSRAELGPSFPNTRKGTVAHMAPSAAAVVCRHQTAPPGAVVLPRWLEGQATLLEPLTPQMAFSSLAFNAFNYMITGADGFRAMADIAERCPVWQLTYSDLDDAISVLDDRWSHLVKGSVNEQSSSG
jgi:HprK-related kinase A